MALHFGSSLTRAQEVLSFSPGCRHIIARADLTDPHAIQSMVEEVAGRLGSIDVVVNDAALYFPHDILTTTYDEWQDA